MHGDDVLLPAMIEEAIDRRPHEFPLIGHPPILQTHGRIVEAAVAAGKAGHLEQALGPELGEFAALPAHRLGESDAMGDVEPIGIVGHGLVEPRLERNVEGEQIMSIGAEQGAIEIEGFGPAMGSGQRQGAALVEAAVIRCRRRPALPAPARQSTGVVPELGNQILSRGVDEGAGERQGERHLDRGAEPLDQLAGFDGIDQGMAEIGVMGEGRPREGALEIGEMEARGKGTAKAGDGAVLILGLDGGEEIRLAPGPLSLGEGMGRLPQAILRQRRQAFEQGCEPGLAVLRPLRAQANPAGHAGIGVGPAIFEPFP